MKIHITSPRGDHEADVETAVAEVVFDKMTGRREKALPAEMKVKVPDTWQELEALWRDGTMSGYTAIGKKDGQDMVGLKQFDPQVQELVFLSPIAGG